MIFLLILCAFYYLLSKAHGTALAQSCDVEDGTDYIEAADGMPPYPEWGI